VPAAVRPPLPLGEVRGEGLGAATQPQPDLQALIDAAILAPSPDNNQPWRFTVGTDHIEVHLDLTQSLPSDVNHMFDLTAIGAAVENACVAARELGFEPHVESLWQKSTGEQQGESIPAARITWSPGGESDPLYPQITRRHTNRNWYSTKAIDPSTLAGLAAEAEQFPGVHVHWLTSRRDIWRFAWLIGRSDRMRFEKEPFHRELYKQLRFTPAEAESTRDGLDLRTLALPPGSSVVLKLLRSWRLLSLLNNFGMSRMLALPAVPQAARSGAIGVLAVERASAEQYLAGGRAFERLWLRGTAAGLALHPLGSLPIYLMQEAHASAGTLRQKVGDLIPASADQQLQIAFRIGHAPLHTPASQFRRAASR
jgi:hypothetical protein